MNTDTSVRVPLPWEAEILAFQIRDHLGHYITHTNAVLLNPIALWLDENIGSRNWRMIWKYGGNYDLQLPGLKEARWFSLTWL